MKNDFVLFGKAKDVFAELDFITRLQMAIGHVLILYQPALEKRLN